MIVFVSGMGGVGKDSIITPIVHTLSKVGYNIERAVYYTTRDKRDNEENGIDYNFISYKEFNDLVADGEIIEERTYHLIDRVVKYGTPNIKDSRGRICILSGSRDQWVNLEDKLDSAYCIDICASPKERINRMLIRAGDNQEAIIEACRRVYQDELDFKKIEGVFEPSIVIHNKDGRLIDSTKEVMNFIRERIDT